MSLTCVQALYDGGCIDEEATTKGTADIWIELVEGEFGLWEHKQNTAYSDAVVWHVSIQLLIEMACHASVFTNLHLLQNSVSRAVVQYTANKG